MFVRCFPLAANDAVHASAYIRNRVGQLKSLIRRKILFMSKHMLDIYYVKPGSHMPPKHLRRSRRYCRVVPAIQLHHAVRPPATRKSEVFTAGMPAKLNSSQLHRHAGGEDSWPLLPATSVLMSEGHRRQYRRLCRW